MGSARTVIAVTGRIIAPTADIDENIKMDTLQITHELMEAKFDRVQAEAVAAVMQKHWAAEVATKADLALVRSDIESFESRIKSHIDQKMHTHTLWVFAAIATLGVIQHFFR